MVVLLKLDEGSSGLMPGSHSLEGGAAGLSSWPPAPTKPAAAAATPGGRRAVQLNGLSAILACYPVAAELASFLDLNTLHSLSRTCHAIRAQLLQCRPQLMAKALRCSNEPLTDRDAQLRNGAASARYHSHDVPESYGVAALQVTSEKVGPCARDMVGECRRCRRVVCRNCIMKPPSSSRLANRHRRLCQVCARAPLAQLLGSAAATAIERGGPSYLPPLTRAPCSCADEVLVCAPCGHATSSADLNYRRIWSWRTRYSTYLGGLGTGIGEGNEGVQCARDDACLAAKDIEVELDCASAEDLAHLDWVPVDDQAGPAAATLEAVSESGEKAGYLRQEIEGIGGVVRTKFKKRVRVGSTVEEREDERASGKHLAREASGVRRSWCGWCNRVVLGARDIERAKCASDSQA